MTALGSALDKKRYRKVYCRLWTHAAFHSLTDADKVTALYLLSGPQTNRIGFFRLSLGAAAEDLDRTVGKFSESLSRVCATFAWEFDAHARVLWIPSWWKFNQPSGNANNILGALADLSEIPETPLLMKFAANRDYIPDAHHHYFTEITPFEHRSNTVPNSVGDTVPNGVGNTVRTQEQETVQEQEQETQTGTPRRQDSLMIPRTHKNHACCGRVCVPASLHGQLVRRSPLPEDEADKELRDWYPTVLARYEGLPILGADDFQFWRDRYTEWKPAPSITKAGGKDWESSKAAALALGKR